MWGDRMAQRESTRPFIANRPLRVLLATPALIAALFATSAQGGWNVHGPYGGFARAVAGSGDHLLLGTTDGVYGTDDAGAHWQRRGDLPRGAVIDSLAISPADSQVILAGNWTNGYRSSDGGAHWTPSNLAFDYAVFHPASAESIAALGSLAYVGANTPILCSSDGGQTFESSGVPAAFVIADRFTANSFIALDASGALYRSIAGCLVWQPAGAIAGSPVGLLQDAVDPNVLYVTLDGLDWGSLERWDVSSNADWWES